MLQVSQIQTVVNNFIYKFIDSLFFIVMVVTNQLETLLSLLRGKLDGQRHQASL